MDTNLRNQYQASLVGKNANFDIFNPNMWNPVETLDRGIVKLRRKRLANRCFKKYGGIIQYGSFKGMRLSGYANVSRGSLGLKIFGLYEATVMQILADWCPTNTLINIGAGDGYYSVGMVYSGLVKNSICFEATEQGRSAIIHNAKLNGVEDRIHVLGVANQEAVVRAINDSNCDCQHTIVLCDIEGCEYELLNQQTLDEFSEMHMVVELHQGGQAPNALRNLNQRMREKFSTTIFADRPRSWNGIAELEAMHDLDRALLTSEGRKEIGRWLVATPRADMQNSELPRAA